MSSPSSSGSSSSSRSPTPAPRSQKKRKRQETAIDVDQSDSPDHRIAEDDHSESDGDDVSSEKPDASADVPALSHAERRRQKKRAKLEEKERKNAATNKKRKLADGTPVATSSALSKRQNSVWVGNLSFKTTVEALKTFFADAGEITRVNMPLKAGATAANRGFAYVDFATAEAKAAAIAMSEKPLIGRRLLIKDGNDFAGRPGPPAADGDAADSAAKSLTGHSKTAQKILRSQKQPPAPTLFLGNLGFETTVDSIRELFTAHRTVKKARKDEEGKTSEGTEGKTDEGEQPKDDWIRKIRMGTFEDSGLCKGFAFVDFTNTEHATAALVNPKNHRLDGRNLVVEYASADAVRRGGGLVKQKTGEGESRLRNTQGPRTIRKEKLPSRSNKIDGEAATSTDREPRPNRRQENSNAGKEIGKEGRMRDSRLTGGERGPRPRSKPGAALAMAKRESAAILPSQGTKIKF